VGERGEKGDDLSKAKAKRIAGARDAGAFVCTGWASARTSPPHIHLPSTLSFSFSRAEGSLKDRGYICIQTERSVHRLIDQSTQRIDRYQEIDIYLRILTSFLNSTTKQTKSATVTRVGGTFE